MIKYSVLSCTKYTLIIDETAYVYIILYIANKYMVIENIQV